MRLVNKEQETGAQRETDKKERTGREGEKEQVINLPLTFPDRPREGFHRSGQPSLAGMILFCVSSSFIF